MLLLLLWLLLTASVLYVVLKRTGKGYRDVERMFNGPTDWPIFGSALIFIGKDVFKLADKLAKQYPNVFRAYLGPFLYFAVHNAQDAEIVLGNSGPLDKANDYRYLWPWIGQGLLTSRGEKWRRHRKMFSPAFHFKMLEKFVDVFSENNKILCRVLRGHSGKGAFNIHHCIQMYALDNICETAMDTKINALLNSRSEYVKAVHLETDIVCKRLLHFWLRPDWIFSRTELGKASERARKTILGFTEGVIRQRKVERCFKTIGHTGNVDEFNSKVKLAFIDIALEAAEEFGLSDEDIRNEVDTFMLGGYDTISSAVSFTLYEIARHPEIQERIYCELETIFQESDRQPTGSDLKEMKYLEQVIKETLRLYPSLPIIGRAVCRDLKITGGKMIPKGSEIGLLITSIHRNPLYWENPSLFDPDHFNSDAVASRHPYAFLPFSAGPRTCIGQKYAMLEMKSVVSSIIREFQVFPSSNPKDRVILKASLVLQSKTGVKIRVEQRKKSV